MGKVTDFGHPTVELKFRTIETGNGRPALLAQVHDAATGEILMTENLKATAEWLQALGYTWTVGSSGQWHQG